MMLLFIQRPRFGMGAAVSRVITQPPTATSSRHFVRSTYRNVSTQPLSNQSRDDRPFRMAVIGSGPAGFYTAYRVMSLIDGAKVDMYEALPVPFGLVRFGVAPDHPEVKNCEQKFAEVAASPNFTFIGNVAVGTPPAHRGGQSVQLGALLRHYDAVLFSYGASRDRTLGVPGESTLNRIYSAREFVGWYNGLPEFANLNPDLSQDQALVIGQGNVALDVARILLEDVDKLRKTDIAGYALDALSNSRVRRVTVVGRRGPMQAAFTTKELRELMHLPDVAYEPVDGTESLIPSNLKKLPRASRRLMEVLVRGSQTKPHTDASKHWTLEFCLSPTNFRPDPSGRSVIGVDFQKNSLSPDPFHPEARPMAVNDKAAFIYSPLVFRSVGYKSAPLPEFERLGIPFDNRSGVVGNDTTFGRVARSTPDSNFEGLYCAGWVKRGPTGVIATTMEDAFLTGGTIAEDWKSGCPFLAENSLVKGRTEESAGWDGVRSEAGSDLTRSVVDWQGWQAIDRAERERGRDKGKERDKFTSVEDMLSVAGINDHT